MTREKAKELMPIFQAWTEGKTIQWDDEDNDCWKDIEPDEEFYDNLNYRIKPEHEYVSFDNSDELYEAVRKHGNWVKMVNIVEFYHTIIAIYDDGAQIEMEGLPIQDFETLLEKWNWADDGTPCGKFVDENE